MAMSSNQMNEGILTMTNEELRNYLSLAPPDKAAKVLQSIEHGKIVHAFKLMRMTGLIAHHNAAWEKKCMARGDWFLVEDSVPDILRPTGVAFWHEAEGVSGARECWVGYGTLLSFAPMPPAEAIAET